LIELLRRAAATDPGRLALVTDSVELTYADLVRRAEDLAATLHAATPTLAETASAAATEAGDADEPHARQRGGGALRFAIDSVEADLVVPALAAAAAVGAEACVFPPDGPEQVERLLSRFGQSHVLRGAPSTSVATAPAGGDPSSSWASLAAAAGARDRSASAGGRPAPGQPTPGQPAPGQPTPGRPAPEAVLPTRPHLVLTTGTTGEPRGVRHDWARLIRSTARVSMIDAADPGERWLLAYGLHQFAGLQVLLHVFAAGATLVAPAPRRPREGLAAMRRHAVTHASATPTYWRFLLAEMRADGGPAPALRQVTLGGEAAPGPVLDQLRAAFPDAAVSHVYAASEFGATNSTKDGLPGLPADVLDRGEDADVAMKVVDGELWVRSRIGMLGYHGEEPVAADEWRPTGDLVERVGDRLLFRGRVSEIINVGGVKVHPLPIEEAVAAVPGVQVARVFGRPNAMTGAIVAVEIVPAPGADADEVKAAVRAACAELPAAARPRSIKIVAEVSTAGGKIVRRQA